MGIAPHMERVAPKRSATNHASLPIRAHPLVFGVVIFLASELMLFASIFAAYYDLRSIDAQWLPPGVHLDLTGASLGAALMVLSAALLAVARNAWMRRAFDPARLLVFAVALCGVAFITLSLEEWAHTTFTIATDAYGSTFYLMTGMDVLHAVAGVLLLLGLGIGMTRRAFTSENFAGAEAIGYFWWFVVLVSLAVYGTVYLVR
jgi:cytochrome c oxidase subunit III